PLATGGLSVDTIDSIAIRMASNPSDSAVLAVSLRLLIARLARRQRQPAAMEPHDLTPSSRAALATLSHRGAQTLGELAAVEGVQSPTMTRIVAKLEDLGLAERTEDPSDRRVARIAISDRGQALLDEVRTRESAQLQSRLSDMEP